MTYKYVSPSGEFIEGIPARDLSDEEFAVLTADQQEVVAGSNAYEASSPPSSSSPSASFRPVTPPPTQATVSEAKSE